jgi:lysophospholipase L1-like esterase
MVEPQHKESSTPGNHRRGQVLSALVPSVLFLALLEIGCLFYYFQARGPEIFGLQAAFGDLTEALRQKLARQGASRMDDLPPARKIYKALYSPGGAHLLAAFEDHYERDFATFAKQVAAVDSKLIVLYIPSPFDLQLSQRVDEHSRSFFQRMARTHGAHFLDVSEALSSYPSQWTYLTPHNFHLSRLGNRLVAEAVARELRKKIWRKHRSFWRASRHPQRLGDLPPGLNMVWKDDLRPFRVTTNRQGLRMDHSLQWPKKRRRLLLLGDSFTFGINLHDVETYPAFLQTQLRGWEVLNAGVPSYSIPQVKELFAERARFTEPDVTILQVLFNDLYGLFYFERSLYSRNNTGTLQLFDGRISKAGKSRVEPNELERDLLEGLGVDF